MTTARTERALKTLVIVMGVMIIVGFGVVVAVVIGRVARSGAAAAYPFAAAPIEIPRGARIETLAVGTDRLVLALALPEGGRELIVIDLASGRHLGTIELRAAP